MRTRLVVLACLLAAGCSASTPTAAPTPSATQSIPGVQVFTGLSHAHLGKGDYPQDYPQSPPVGGPHSPAWIQCGVYDQQLPKENAVHSMEHGAIWLTYQPDLPVHQRIALSQLAQLNVEYVLVSPYSGQDAPVIATTWGLQLRVQSADDPRLVQFVRAYAGGNQGGEQGVGCRRTGATLEQVIAFDRSQR